MKTNNNKECWQLMNVFQSKKPSEQSDRQGAQQDIKEKKESAWTRNVIYE
jgi:hypothetical protein